jgi:GNAT superfamily N-acetyltransferase
MEIKEAAEKHIPPMLKLWMEATYFNCEAEPFEMKGKNVLDQVEKHFKTKIQSPDALVLVALDEKKVIGYSYSAIQVSTENPKQLVGNIYDMVITADYRRKGIGKTMLGTIQKWFESRGITQIEPSLITRKTINDSFWVKQG